MMLFSMLLKASLLIAIAAVVQVLAARRASAATCHLLWTLATIGLLLLPILSVVLPGWTAVRLTKAETAAAGALVSGPDNDTATLATGGAVDASLLPVIPAASTRIAPKIRMSWSTVLPVIYAAGVVLLLSRVIAERMTIQRLARHATHMTDPEWMRLLSECAGRAGVRRSVRLLRTPERTMPMAFGVWHASVLLPAVADIWPEDRRRAVLLHELAHVARGDCLTQTLAAAACALYWIHPGVWWIARRLRVERELACDDRVLSVGTDARDYAGHLLELAYTLSGNRAPALAANMATARQLEGRMLAVLDAARNRAAPPLRSRVTCAAMMALLVVPLATATTADVPRVTQSAPGSQPPAAPPGRWEIRPTADAGVVHLRLSEEDGFSGTRVEVEQLDGLLAAQLSGAGSSVQFSLRRDAGTFTFEGIFRNGVGAGTFSFLPNATFTAELAKRGFERPAAGELGLLARENIGLAFLDELAAQNYARPRLAELVRAARHGVGLAYLREMGRSGYRLARIEMLVELRDHGVTPEFIRGLAAGGLSRLSSDELIQARDHGVSPEYIQELNRLGFRTLSLDTLVDARNHGISPEYVRELRERGYTLTLDELTRARNHGISGKYVRGIAALGYERLSLDDLIRLRNHGVGPDYVRELNELGYVRLDIDELVGLRNHGVTADKVRRANARAGRRLPTDALEALAAKGWK